MFLLKIFDFCLHEKEGLHTEEDSIVCSVRKDALLEKMQEHIRNISAGTDMTIRTSKNLTYQESEHVYAEYNGQEYIIAVIEPVEVIE